MIEVDEFFEKLSNYVRVHLYNRAQNTHSIHLICQNFNGIQSFIDPRVSIKKRNVCVSIISYIARNK